MKAYGVIAEDELVLAAHLRAELAALWPELEVVALVEDGESAVRETLALRPDVLFLDIHMPVLDGLQAAAALAEDWPADATRFPLIVFVTAYDQYALQAFERAAIDYVQKPIVPARLAVTCARLQQMLALRADREQSDEGSANVVANGPARHDVGANAELDAIVERLRLLLPTEGASPLSPLSPAAERLSVLQIGVGDIIRMVPIAEVLCLEASGKYVNVLTATREHLVRLSLRELLPRLDPEIFWQVHRGTVVRADAVESAHRDENGRLTLALRGRPQRFAVSRLYANRFKAM